MHRLIILALLLAAATAQARIGETPQQLIARFGQPTGKGESGEVEFEKNGVKISAFFWNGRCCRIAYFKDKGLPTKDLLQMNSVDGGWVEKDHDPSMDYKGNHEYASAGKAYEASTSFEHVSICNVAAHGARMKAWNARKKTETISGF